MNTRRIGILFSLLPSLLVASQPLRTFDFKTYLRNLDEYRECSDPPSTRVNYADLTGDGVEEAVVQGSSCLTGTAGPDIHKVFTAGGAGRARELSIPEADKEAYATLFGNPNYELLVESGRLVAKYSDNSGRDYPLVIRYRWQGDRFQVDSVTTLPTYPTSYDCARATEAHERAICHVKPLADLDRELDAAYRHVRNKLPPDKRRALANEEKKWLVSRNQSCTIYKWWVECLEEAYQKRIAELNGD